MRRDRSLLPSCWQKRWLVKYRCWAARERVEGNEPMCQIQSRLEVVVGIPLEGDMPSQFASVLKGITGYPTGLEPSPA